jgi:hypothetical protein
LTQVNPHHRCAAIEAISARRLQMYRKLAVVGLLALALAGCQTARQDRALGGALIGGGTGALIGGLAGQSAGAAVAGGIIGAAAGAIIADVTRPGYCYYYDRKGRKRYVRC